MHRILSAGLETLSLKENQLSALGRLTGLRRLHTLLLTGNAIRSVATDALSGDVAEQRLGFRVSNEALSTGFC